MNTPKGYKAIITLESKGWLLGGTRKHESSVFDSKEDAQAFAVQSEEVNRNRPGYQDAVILTRVEPVYPKIGRTRKAVQSRNEIVSGQPIRCYDNGGTSLDRYTVVFTSREAEYQRNMYGSRLYPCLSMNARPFHPQGIGQHGDCVLGKHLGKRIKFSELPEECQQAALQDLNPQAQ